MEEHPSEQILDGYRQRKLVAADLLAADDHLAICEKCRQRMSEGQRLSKAFNSLAEALAPSSLADEHLTYQQLVALVDKEAGDVEREIAEVHLQSCLRCTTELQDLEQFANSPRASAVSTGLRGSERVPLLGWLTWPRFAMATSALLVTGALIWIALSPKSEPIEVANSGIASPSPAPTSTQPGVSPTPVASPRILLTLKDAGRTVTMDETGNIDGLGELSPSMQNAVRTTLMSETLKISPAISALRTNKGTLMGAGGDQPFQLLMPVGTAVRSDQPVFRWQPLEGATSYMVKIYDTNFTELAASPPQQALSWRPINPLPRGQIYLWQVTARKDGAEIKSPRAPAPEARFLILAREIEAEIARRQKTQPRSHLLLGTLFAEAGLFSEAQHQFQLLLNANPNSHLVKKLLREVSR